MAGTVKKLSFAEGVNVTPPTDLSIATSTTNLATYASDSAYATANGGQVNGSVYVSTALNKFRYYVSGAWRNAVPESDTSDTTKTFLVDVSGNTTAISAKLLFAATANRTYTFPDASDTVTLLGATQTLTGKTLTSPKVNTSLDVTTAAAFALFASLGANTLSIGGSGSTSAFLGNVTVGGTLAVTGSASFGSLNGTALTQTTAGNFALFSNMGANTLTVGGSSSATTFAGTTAHTGAATFASTATVTGALRSAASLILEDPGAGTHIFTQLAPTLSADWSFTWPTALPISAGYVLSSDASGIGSWVAPLTNPMTAQWDIIIGGTSGAATRLAIGTGVLRSVGSTITWAQLVDADVAIGAAITGSKIVSATNLVSGVMTTGVQDFQGVKTFHSGINELDYLGFGTTFGSTTFIATDTSPGIVFKRNGTSPGVTCFAFPATTAGSNVTLNDAMEFSTTGSINFPQGIALGGSLLTTYIAPTAYTPVMSTTGTNFNVTFSVQYGYYTQIGKLVFFNAFCAWTNNNTAGNGAIIINLPVQAQNVTNSQQIVNAEVSNIISGSANLPYFVGEIDNNGSNVALVACNAGASLASAASSSIGTLSANATTGVSRWISFSGCYIAK